MYNGICISGITNWYRYNLKIYILKRTIKQSRLIVIRMFSCCRSNIVDNRLNCLASHDSFVDIGDGNADDFHFLFIAWWRDVRVSSIHHDSALVCRRVGVVAEQGPTVNQTLGSDTSNHGIRGHLAFGIVRSVSRCRFLTLVVDIRSSSGVHIEQSEVIGYDGDGECDEEHPGQGTHGANGVSHGGGGVYVPISYSSHGDDTPPKSYGYRTKLRVFNLFWSHWLGTLSVEY